MTTPTQSDFERGVRAGVEAFDLYLRGEDEVMVLAEAREQPDGTAAWERMSSEDLRERQSGAIGDALRDEDERLRRRTSLPDESAPQNGSSNAEVYREDGSWVATFAVHADAQSFAQLFRTASGTELVIR